jgi:chemotaxis protein MotB
MAPYEPFSVSKCYNYTLNKIESKYMKTSFWLLFVLAIGILFTGCVSKKQFGNLKADYTQLQTAYQENQVQLTESRTRALSLEERLSEAQQHNSELRASLSDMQDL